MTTLVLPVGQTQPTLDLLEFAQPPGSPLVGVNAAPVTGYPSASKRVRSLAAQLSIHTDPEATHIWALASNPTDITKPVTGTPSPGASGVWTGASGSETTWSGDLKGWKMPNWGAWETDYVAFTTSSLQILSISGPSGSEWQAWPMDLRVRCRRADWDGASGIAVLLRYTDQGMFSDGGSLYFRWYSGGGTVTRSIPWSTLGVADGEWIWLRVTGDDTDGLRWWTSTDGSSWTVKGTDSAPGMSAWMTTTGPPKIGGGGAIGGWNGDISDVTFSELGGAQKWTLNRPAITSASITTWDSGVAGRPWVRYSSTLPQVIGAVRGTETITFTSASPFPVGDVRFIFGANDKGRITVDTLTFDLAPRPGGWSIGMVRGGRG